MAKKILPKKQTKKTISKNKKVVKKKVIKKSISEKKIKEKNSFSEFTLKTAPLNSDTLKVLPCAPEILKKNILPEKQLKVLPNITSSKLYKKNVKDIISLSVDFLLGFFISVGIIGGISFLTNLAKNGFNVAQLGILGVMSLVVTYILKK